MKQANFEKLVLRHVTIAVRLCSVILFAGLSVLNGPVNAQEWPKKQPIKLVVPWPPGGAADFLARQLAPVISQQIGQQIVVENKAGAATNIGSDSVAKSKPDGYTLLLASSNNAANMALFKTLPYDTVRDFSPVALVGNTPMVLVVNPSVPANTLNELVRYAQDNPKKLLYASAGNGSPAHLAAEKFLRAANVQIVHVPYKGAAPAVTDLIGGQVQLLITNVPASIEHIKSGRLRALAITGKNRSSALPAVPTFSQAGLPTYEADGWYGLVAPSGTPPFVIKTLTDSVFKALSDPALVKRLEQQGIEIAPRMSPAEFAQFIQRDISSYQKLVKESGITLD